MNGHDPTPERLDAILDARAPAVTGPEREMVDLAAALRDATPPAGPELRARVRAIAAPRPAGRLRRLTGSWRGRALIAAPALAAVAVAVIATGVIGGNGTAGESARVDATTSVESQTQAPPTAATARGNTQAPADAQARSAPGPAATGLPGGIPVRVTIRVPPADVTARAAEARRIVIAAGGAIQESTGGTGAGGVAITAAVPAAGAADALARLRALGGYVPSSPTGTPSTAAEGATAVAIRIVPSS
jgi:hypothetical protein